MSFSINFTPFFEREFKKLLKKHGSLKKDLEAIINLLNENPRSGESIGNNCYKIRMSISSKNKGKSGGARVITHVRFMNEEIFLLSIYDKSSLSTIAEEQLLIRIKSLK
ncbi:mRNA-degrading endonuclease RelE, toxin component of the RelBE toxin-antitoxin system [Mucilaginibacter sp. OK098]|nr:type II toxin-antitoxin system RelE/ParE family toxin [Mucilaginibacter sp. OK098]SHN18803.1 mRNA-degrading endonuclease RelE, toxin component of the RelBE toxin-antitoxin system [Mucilaginibacter sp. OK098]